MKFITCGWLVSKIPSKNTLARNIARIARKGPFPNCIPARSCVCTRSYKILQECKKKGPFLAILAVFLARAFLLDSIM